MFVCSCGAHFHSKMARKQHKQRRCLVEGENSKVYITQLETLNFHINNIFYIG